MFDKLVKYGDYTTRTRSLLIDTCFSIEHPLPADFAASSWKAQRFIFDIYQERHLNTAHNFVRYYNWISSLSRKNGSGDYISHQGIVNNFLSFWRWNNEYCRTNKYDDAMKWIHRILEQNYLTGLKINDL